MIERQDYTVSLYDKEGVDYMVAVVRVNEKSCNLYYVDGVEFKYLSGLTSKDGSELTEDAIMSHVTIAFGNG